MEQVKRKCVRRQAVIFVLERLQDKASYVKNISDDLTRDDSNIYFGQYLAFEEAIKLIKAVIL